MLTDGVFLYLGACIQGSIHCEQLDQTYDLVEKYVVKTQIDTQPWFLHLKLCKLVYLTVQEVELLEASSET